MSLSRTKAVQSFVGVVAAGALAVSFSGCGDDVPTGAVAKIGDVVVTKKAFEDYYAGISTNAEQQLGNVPETSDAPNFTACVEESKQTLPKGQEAQDAELRKQCKDAYEQVKTQAMQFLIQSQWVVQEAEDQDVSVSDAEVVQRFQQQKKQSFPKEKDYRKFLRDSGTNEGNILFQIKVQTLQEKLTEKIQKDGDEVSDEDIEEYYEENKETFATPAQRDLEVVLTKTKAKADAAKKELEGGAKFSKVAKEYSIDEPSKANGGKLLDVAQGQQEADFDKAVFAADQGALEGPVKTQFGWYVFKVNDVTPAGEQSLDAVKDQIRTQLESQSGSEELRSFITKFQREFLDKTVCADDYLMAACGNDPSTKTDTGPASGGHPDGPQAAPGGAAPGAPPAAGGAQGAPPQQAAPQQGAPQQAAPPSGP